MGPNQLSKPTAYICGGAAGETQWRAEFLEPDGEFQTGIFQAMVKNW
jgi:hypothetical protein